jgi:hypothetical protein
MSAPPPVLPYDSWMAAKDTLHLWCQVVGKTKLALTARRNHWWNVTLQVSARGLTTSRLPSGASNLELELDLVDHRLRARTTRAEAGFDLVDGLSVAAFQRRLEQVLDDLGVRATIRGVPFGVPMTTPFAEDEEHASYDPDAAGAHLAALQWSADVFDEFSGWSNLKTSPVHVFWHSLDLAVTRFSGRPAPPNPAADPVSAEAYSHEVVSFGFWAGDQDVRFPAYYAYAAPEPAGLRDQPLRPDSATWVEQRGGSLAILPYEEVCATPDPRRTLLDFLQSAYEAGAGLAGWDIAGTATSWSPVAGVRARSAGTAPQGGTDG